MFDSDDPGGVPRGTAVVGGYVNGHTAWPTTAWLAFPGAARVRINVTGEPGRGDCLDVETGDATPADCVRWWESCTWVAPADRLIYCSRDTVGKVRAAMADRPWALWLATLDGTLETAWDGKAVTACQYLGAAVLGFHADMSLILSDTWRP
jgi:hypothetical protein